MRIKFVNFLEENIVLYIFPRNLFFGYMRHRLLTDDGPWMRIETSLINILFTIIINMKLLSFIFVMRNLIL